MGNQTIRSNHQLTVIMKILWWVIAGGNLFLYLLAIPREYQVQLAVATRDFIPSLTSLNLTPHFYAVFLTTLDTLSEAAFILIGAYIFIRKPSDWMVFLVAIASMTFSSMFVPTLAHLVELEPVYSTPVAVIRAAGLASSLIVFCYIFPDGRFVPRATLILSMLWTGLSLFWLFNPRAPYNIIHLTTWLENLAPSVGILFAAYGTGVFAQFWRFKHENQPVRRQQIKWFLFGLIGALIGFLLYYLGLILFPVLNQPGIYSLLYILFGVPFLHLAVLLVPFSLAVAISRLRLWDVDLLINRSLVYTFLTGFIILIYVSIILGFEQVFHRFFGWDRSPVAIALSTLLIAYLFTPLRNLIQARVNRRFYRQRYNSDQVLVHLNQKMQDEVDPIKLAEVLLDSIDSTLHPEHISIWMRKPDSDSSDTLTEAAK